MRNPDYPKKCPQLMKDGIHCFEKSLHRTYEDDVISGKEDWLVKCPFIKKESSDE